MSYRDLTKEKNEGWQTWRRFILPLPTIHQSVKHNTVRSLVERGKEKHHLTTGKWLQGISLFQFVSIHFIDRWIWTHRAQRIAFAINVYIWPILVVLDFPDYFGQLHTVNMGCSICFGYSSQCPFYACFLTFAFCCQFPEPWMSIKQVYSHCVPVSRISETFRSQMHGIVLPSSQNDTVTRLNRRHRWELHDISQCPTSADKILRPLSASTSKLYGHNYIWKLQPPLKS